MYYILIGCAAFVFVFIFDLNKAVFKNRLLAGSFGLGGLLLTASTLAIIFTEPRGFQFSVFLQILFWILTVVSLLLLIYALFFALPYDQTYLKIGQAKVIDTGMYGLCRHPGVVWFFFFYLFLSMASGKMMMLWAGTIWTLFNITLSLIEDFWLFPRLFSDYKGYKRKVPFLIPNRASIRRFVSSM